MTSTELCSHSKVLEHQRKLRDEKLREIEQGNGEIRENASFLLYNSLSVYIDFVWEFQTFLFSRIR